MPNRKTPPPVHTATNLALPKPDTFRLRNGLPVYAINMGTQDVVKAELIFFAGRPNEEKEMVARMTARMLREGTTSHSAAEIAEKIDFYGGTLSFPINLDTTNVVLYALNKHLENLLPIVSEILTQPAFPQHELEAFVVNSKQRLKVDLSKNDTVAYRQITENIYGPTHPYGYNSSAEKYDRILREDLIRHHQKGMVAGNAMLFLGGKVDKKVIDLVDRYLGDIPVGNRWEPKPFLSSPTIPQKGHFNNPDSVQTAIYTGRRLFNKKHPDYLGMYVLNTILGDYFGSRLVKNIREQKGYTYNIYSSMDTMRYDGFFYVGTEVSHDKARETVAEIYREMTTLQTDLVDEKELVMVKNYLLGSLLTLLDGPLNSINVVREVVSENLPTDYFDQLVQTIQHIRPEAIRELARKYLHPDDFWEMTVGSLI